LCERYPGACGTKKEEIQQNKEWWISHGRLCGQPDGQPKSGLSTGCRTGRPQLTHHGFFNYNNKLFQQHEIA
ncbi:MAG: hypothetical protein ACRER2_09590, partial [Methylococcales bacterium]